MIYILVLIILAIIYWLFMSSYSQIFGTYIWHAKTDEKIIALTFDDGPNDPYTSEVLDILAENHIKATFFMVGNCIKRFPDTANRILAAGHSIGNHSVSHKFINYFKPNFYQLEVESNQNIFKEYLNITPTLYRSPWLWRYPKLLSELKERSLTPISGEFCHSLEVYRINSDKIAKAVIRKAKPGSIIIFHDGKEGETGDRSQTVEALKLVIKRLVKDGYRFVTVDELLKIN
jgi:peptidoglycan/xylan/chitin deacetylase (PgdA/CDA1 family)